jgi:hypothetical protein
MILHALLSSSFNPVCWFKFSLKKKDTRSPSSSLEENPSGRTTAHVSFTIVLLDPLTSQKICVNICHWQEIVVLGIKVKRKV